jgi:hypothetical protein
MQKEHFQKKLGTILKQHLIPHNQMKWRGVWIFLNPLFKFLLNMNISSFDMKWTCNIQAPTKYKWKGHFLVILMNNMPFTSKWNLIQNECMLCFFPFNKCILGKMLQVFKGKKSMEKFLSPNPSKFLLLQFMNGLWKYIEKLTEYIFK